jgi:hypothetical protein
MVTMKKFLNILSFLIVLSANMSIAAEKPPVSNDPYASYGGNTGHQKFLEHRGRIVKTIAGTIPAYCNYISNNGKQLSSCYPKHIKDIGNKRREIAKETGTSLFEEFGLPREDSHEMHHTPTDDPKHADVKRTSLRQLATLLRQLVGTSIKTTFVEDEFSMVRLTLLTPDEWPISLSNKVLHDSSLFKRTGKDEFLPAYKQATFYKIFESMLDVFWVMSPPAYRPLVLKLIKDNPLMNFKDTSKQAMEAFKAKNSAQDTSMSLLQMQVILRHGKDIIPMTSVYCFVPTFPKVSQNGITPNSITILESEIFSPFIEHTDRLLFPKLHPIVADLWQRAIILEPKTAERLVTTYAMFAYVFYNQMPFARGTASVGEFECEGIQLYHFQKNTIPNLVFPLEGLQKLDQVAMGGILFSQFLEHVKKTVKIVKEQPPQA